MIDNSSRENQINSFKTDDTGNPFIDSIIEYLSLEGLPARLATSPLDGVTIGDLSSAGKIALLNRLQEEFFEPTENSLLIATRLYRLIHKGYLNRNPTKSSVRRQTMEIAGFAELREKPIPWFSTSAKGMTITGVTGLGKSHEIKRALGLLPRVVEHGRSVDAGWEKMKQVTWLYVGMSHDGSLGGLMLQILVALDEVLESEYARDASLVKCSIEKLAVKLGVILRNHGVGVLVIDEIQERNFTRKNRGDYAVTFFLRLLNFGIPVVLMGNPLGLKVLDTFSQDIRRIGSGGTICVYPDEISGFDWVECFVPALWRQSVMPELSPIENKAELLFEYSGGIRDMASRVYVGAQILAIDLGDRFVTEDHLLKAFLGADFSDKERELIVGFRDKDIVALNQFDDIPWQDLALRWGINILNVTSLDDNNSRDFPAEVAGKAKNKDKPAKSVSQTDLEIIKRNRTRKANKVNTVFNVRKNLSAEDMRKNGMSKVLITGLDSFMSA